MFLQPSSAGDRGIGQLVVPAVVPAGQPVSVSFRVSAPLSQPVVHDRVVRVVAAAVMAWVRVRSTAPAARIWR
ncbi:MULTISPECIES: hypothetical protein [unclassified Arthrobacter]|uniref:hypothetical protein n=1 Tax=Pseudarthrobacter sp. S6 TaxID=3418420 RepID=UPI0033982874